MSTPIQDVKYRLRQPCRNARFNAAAVVTLALGIAAGTASQGAGSAIARAGSAAEQVIPAKRSISGTVQYADTHEPIADVHVFVSTRNGYVSAETDILGRYRLEGIALGEYWMPMPRRDIPLGSRRSL